MFCVILRYLPKELGSNCFSESFCGLSQYLTTVEKKFLFYKVFSNELWISTSKHFAFIYALFHIAAYLYHQHAYLFCIIFCLVQGVNDDEDDDDDDDDDEDEDDPQDTGLAAKSKQNFKIRPLIYLIVVSFDVKS